MKGIEMEENEEEENVLVSKNSILISQHKSIEMEKSNEKLIS